VGDPYLGEIRMFGFGEPVPAGWRLCNGDLLEFQDKRYTALFSLIGTSYGGDGVKFFALPDFRGRVPMGAGQHADGDHYDVGGRGGTESVALTEAQVPRHTHPVSASSKNGNASSPAGNVLAAAQVYAAADPGARESLEPRTVADAGGTPHENMQPSLCLRFCIAVEGIFPGEA
jgi:microcystin-dependent protein